MSDMQYGPRRPGYYGAYENTAQSRAALTEEAACGLAEQYDVSCLSRNEYSLLLCSLRNAGFITTQEFSAGYGGTLPRGAAVEPPEPFPLGDNKADFVVLLEQYVQYCGEVRRLVRNGPERAHTKSLLTTYSRLYTLFSQIHDAASGAE